MKKLKFAVTTKWWNTVEYFRSIKEFNELPTTPKYDQPLVNQSDVFPAPPSGSNIISTR